MREDLKTQLLKTIELSGSASEDSIVIRQLINRNPDIIIDKSSGKWRIKPPVLPKFNLIISQPESLKALSSLSIRCMICGKVLSYPAWYHRIEFAVNVIHYFICFNASNASRPTLACKRRK